MENNLLHEEGQLRVSLLVVTALVLITVVAWIEYIFYGLRAARVNTIIDISPPSDDKNARLTFALAMTFISMFAVFIYNIWRLRK